MKAPKILTKSKTIPGQSIMEYEDFDLHLERSKEQNYIVRLANSPAGPAEAYCDLSLIETEFEDFLSKIARFQIDTDRKHSLAIKKTAKAFGGKLFDALFNGAVFDCFRRSFSDVQRQNLGLRIRLHLIKVPELANLPWEYMYDTTFDRFLSHTVQTPIVRYIELAERIEPYPMKPPLRVLVMISLPRDTNPIDVEAERTKLTEALGSLLSSGLVEIDYLERATLKELQRQLRQKEYHIFHFIGHGGFDMQVNDGFLSIENEQNLSRMVTGEYLGTLLYDERQLRLVVLNTCEGGRTSSEDPFAGTAQSLIKKGIPAVIAMQFMVTDTAAITFTEAFYAAIADSYPVDAALIEARKALYVRDVEWGAPVLYTRTSDGKIFDIELSHEEKAEMRTKIEEISQGQKDKFPNERVGTLPPIPLSRTSPPLRTKRKPRLIIMSAAIGVLLIFLFLAWYYRSTWPQKDTELSPLELARSDIKYLDFDLFIERSAERQYRARALTRLFGETVTDFSLPFDSLQIENFLLKVGRPRRGLRNVRSLEMDAVKNFGSQLFNCVFNGELKNCLRRSLDEAERQGCGLRLRLRMTKAPELSDLPWEYLYYNTDINRFLSLSIETPIVRYLELPDFIKPLGVEPPLRILVMISSPHDYHQLDVEQEWARLDEAFKELQNLKLVKLERLGKPTLYQLQRQLQGNNYHIFHFIGHGSFDKNTQQGVLIMEDDQGRGREVSSQDMGVILHDADKLRLVLLNACEGARSSRDDPFAGIAQSLVQQGIPAVIAMQFEVTDAAAITLANEFYTALASGYPVDAALAEARKAIFAQNNDIEWGTPALYMRSPDGRIFDIKR